MQEDPELLRRYIENRSNEAFSDLVRRHLNLVYCSALRRANGNRHLAEDITQLVFIALAREASSLRARPVLAGWLYVATRNAAAKAMRTEKRRTTREQEAYAMQESSFSPTPETDWDRIRPQLETVLDELDERDRDAVLLRFFQNRPFAEIGQNLRISDDAARMRVDRALEKLRALLARRGITSTTAALAFALENQAAAAAPASLAATVNNAVLASGALAGAGSAASSGTFNFMSTTTLTIGIAGVICTLATGFAIRESSQASQAQVALASTSKTSAEQIRHLQATVAALEKSRAATEKSATESKPAVPDSAPAPEAMKKKKKAEPTTSFSESMKNPVYAMAWRKQQLRNFDSNYGDAFTALNLPPEKLAKLKELLLGRQETANDTVDAGRAAGLTRDEVNKAAKQSRIRWNEEIKGLIGETGLAQLERSEKAHFIKPSIESTFAVDLRKTGIPLSPDQVTNLAFSMFDYWEVTLQPTGIPLQGMQTFTTAKEVDPQTALTLHAQVLLDRYAQYLTPAQHQVVKDYFVEQTKWAQLSRKQ